MSVFRLFSVFVIRLKKAPFSIFIAFLLTKFSKVYHFAWKKLKISDNCLKNCQKILKHFFGSSKTKKYVTISTKIWIFDWKLPYFSIFEKPSVISVIKVGYRFYSVIKMSVLDRFRLDKIWSVSVRLSVNRLFDYITI